MKNTLSDLNNYLFEQIEMLNFAETAEELETAIKRSNAIFKISRNIIAAADVSLRAKEHMDEYGQGDRIEIPLLGIRNEK